MVVRFEFDSDSLTHCYLFLIILILQYSFLLFAGDLGVVREFHGGVGAAGGDGAEGGDVAEHLLEGHFGVDGLDADLGGDVLQHAAAAVEVAGDIADVGVGGQHFEFHDGLEEDGIGLAAGGLEADFGAELEAELVGVDRVEGAVDDAHLHAVDGVSGEDAVLHGFLESFLEGRHVFLGDVAALDLVDELETHESFVGGADFEEDIGELTLAAGLLLVDFVVLHRGGDGFLVGHLGTTLVDVDAEFAAQAVHDDVEVEFAHAADDCLSADLVGFDAEGGVFLDEFHEGVGHFVHVGLGVGLDGDGDDGLGELHRFEDDGVLFIAEGVAGLDFLESDGSADVASLDAVEGVLLVGVHLHDAGDAFFLAGVGVVDVGAALEGAAVHAEEAEASDVGVGGDFEGECGEGGFDVDLAGLFLVVLGVDTHDLGFVEGAGEEGRDSVKQRLDAFVLEGGAAHDRYNFLGQGGLADFGNHFLFGDGVGIVEEFHHKLLVFLGDAFDKFLAVFRGDFLEVVGHGHFVELGAVRAFVPDEGFVGDEVDDAFEEVFLSDGDFQRDGVGSEAFLDLADHREEVGACAVHLVDEGDAGHAVLVGLTPDGLTLGFDTADGAEDGDGAVEDAERALHFDGEVHVARGVDDVVLVAVGMPFPVHGGGGGGDGDASFLFLHHPVHSGAALVGFTELVVFAGVEEDALCRRRFAGVDVGHDTDVARVLEV